MNMPSLLSSTENKSSNLDSHAKQFQRLLDGIKNMNAV